MYYHESLVGSGQLFSSLIQPMLSIQLIYLFVWEFDLGPSIKGVGIVDGKGHKLAKIDKR